MQRQKKCRDYKSLKVCLSADLWSASRVPRVLNLTFTVDFLDYVAESAGLHLRRCQR